MSQPVKGDSIRDPEGGMTQRTFLKSAALRAATASIASILPGHSPALAGENKGESNMSVKPNIIYFHVDNLGLGELGCYGGGKVRGAETGRIDKFAGEGLQRWHYVAEPQCTPETQAMSWFTRWTCSRRCLGGPGARCRKIG